LTKDGKLNQYTLLPPITPQNPYGDEYQGSQSIDHLISQAPSKVSAENYGLKNVPLNMGDQQQSQKSNRDDNSSSFLPRQPVQLSEMEENSLMNDVMRAMNNYGSDQLKGLYSELTSYDPNLSGSVHNMYVSLVAMRNKVGLVSHQQHR
jgi:hypothetical protein